MDTLRVEVVASGAPTRLYPDTSTTNEGSITDFSNIQDENGNFAVLEGDTGGGPNQDAFDIETTTQDVPSGDYTLELGLGTVDPQRGSGSITVTVQDESGATVGSTSLTDADSNTVVTVSLGTIDPQQDIVVRYQGDRRNDVLEIDYQRLVEQ